MGEIVKIYRVRSDFRNIPDKLVLDRPSSEYAYEESCYILPEGYSIDDTMYGPRIFDQSGRGCDLVLAGNVVLAVTGYGSVALRPAPGDASPASIRTLRMERHLTQKQLATAAGVNIRLIQKLEGGEASTRNTTASNLVAIADALGVDVHDLIGGGKA